MIGVCIGIGSGWSDVAQWACERMYEMTWVRCLAIKRQFHECVHPSWLKAKIIDLFPEEDSFLIFDADIICLRKWKPNELFESMGRPFMCAPDERLQCVYEECEELGIAFPDAYVNGGLTIFGREHKPIWDAVWAKHPKCGRWLEQGALNLALLEQNPQICRLPRRFNRVTHLGRISQRELELEGVVNLHACGCKNAQSVREIQKLYEGHHTAAGSQNSKRDA